MKEEVGNNKAKEAKRKKIIIGGYLLCISVYNKTIIKNE